jgi:hypothetical protein
MVFVSSKLTAKVIKICNLWILKSSVGVNALNFVLWKYVFIFVDGKKWVRIILKYLHKTM